MNRCSQINHDRHNVFILNTSKNPIQTIFFCKNYLASGNRSGENKTHSKHKKSRAESNFITHEVSFKWSESCSFYYQNSQHEFNCVCHSSIAKRSSGFRRFCMMPKTFVSMFDSTTTSLNSLRFKEILPTKKKTSLYGMRNFIYLLKILLSRILLFIF